MIGQAQLLLLLDLMRDDMSHFIVLTGPAGSGKRTIAKYIANEFLHCVYSEVDTKVDSVREVIESAYKSATKVLYCFADADTMRAEAKNAMLKITEEPPVNAYFIMTVQDDSTLLDTIKSRASVLTLLPYSESDLLTYMDYIKYPSNPSSREMLAKVCQTPGDINLMQTYDEQEFYSYVRLVYDNIAEVEPANAFKSSAKLAIKDEQGYDLRLFWQMFQYIALMDLLSNTPKIQNGSAVLITQQCLNKLQKVGVNKQQLYDSWVFDIREAWV